MIIFALYSAYTLRLLRDMRDEAMMPPCACACKGCSAEYVRSARKCDVDAPVRCRFYSLRHAAAIADDLPDIFAAFIRRFISPPIFSLRLFRFRY